MAIVLPYNSGARIQLASDHEPNERALSNPSPSRNPNPNLTLLPLRI